MEQLAGIGFFAAYFYIALGVHCSYLGSELSCDDFN